MSVLVSLPYSSNVFKICDAFNFSPLPRFIGRIALAFTYSESPHLLSPLHTTHHRCRRARRQKRQRSGKGRGQLGGLGGQTGRPPTVQPRPLPPPRPTPGHCLQPGAISLTYCRLPGLVRSSTVWLFVDGARQGLCVPNLKSAHTLDSTEGE